MANPASASPIRLDVFSSMIAAIDTAGTPAARAGISDSCTEIANSARPVPIAWSEPPSPGWMISTSMPASS